MKNFQTIFMFLLPLNLFCQQPIIVDCSSMRLTGTIYYPNANAVVPLFGYYTQGGCSFLMSGGFDETKKFYIEKQFLNSNNERYFEPVSSYQSSSVFSNLSHGTHRIIIATPTLEIKPLCAKVNNANGYVPVLSYSTGQFIGYKSSYYNTYRQVSNHGIIGQTQQSDVDWSFVHNGFSTGNSSGDAFDYGEEVFMNPIKTVNYTAYWIAIFESGSSTRNRGTGWVQGQRIFDISLSEIWAGFTGWQFEVGNTYTVQYAISNGNCPGPWTNLDKSFYVCPAGSNCRLNTEKIQKDVTISPNPAQNTFQLNNFDKDMYKNKEYNLTINDISGKQIKSYENFDNPNFDIADLPSGLYIVNLSESNKKLMSRKLVVSR